MVILNLNTRRHKLAKLILNRHSIIAIVVIFILYHNDNNSTHFDFVHKVAAHFTNTGYDTLESISTLTNETLADIEAFNDVKWLPGHKVRLQQIFSDVVARVREWRQRAVAVFIVRLFIVSTVAQFGYTISITH